MTMTATYQVKKFSWSYSPLKNYETCPKRHYHYDIAKDIQGDSESEPIREGKQMHAAFDARLRAGTPLPLGLGHYEPMLVRILAAPGHTYSERKLALSSNYQPVAWFSAEAWFRGILDCTKINGRTASVFDWKNGKPSHDTTQLQLSAALVFHSAPAIQQVRAGLVFANHDKVESATFERRDLPEIWNEILPRVRRLQRAREAQEYPPKPSGLCRRWCGVVSCPYHGIGG